MEILVVDNASNDNSLEGIGDYPGVVVLPLKQNKGFAAAANTGARAAGAPCLLFLNPDITHTRNNLSVLLHNLENHPDAAGGCGLLVGNDGKAQKQFQLQRIAGPRWGCLDLFFPPALKRRTAWFRTHYYMARAWSEAFPVEQPAAACLLLKTEVFREMDGFDESFSPAWFEDVDLAARLHQAEKPLWFWPEAVFVHHGGYSADALGRADFLKAYWRNARRYYRKHYPFFGRLYGILFPCGASRRLRGCRHRPSGRERRAWREALADSLGTLK